MGSFSEGSFSCRELRRDLDLDHLEEVDLLVVDLREGRASVGEDGRR